MALRYTSKEAIANRLQGKLQVGGPASAFGATVADDPLIEQVGGQVEDRVDNALRQQYKLPLKFSHPSLASVVEKLAIAELIPVYDQAEAAAKFTELMLGQGEKELERLASGDVVLYGEIMLQAGLSVVQNTTQAAARTPGPAEAIDW